MPFNPIRNSKSMRDLLANQEKEYPDTADAYQLLEACGRGVSGEVWRTMCKPFQEIVAVKLLDLESLNCRMEEVIQEAQTMCLAHHPNLLSLNTCFVSGKHLWMVMPYMPGGSALNIMRYKHPQGLDELTIAIIMKEVAKALEYIHKGGGIHRDIKAGNILVGQDGSVLLADFGVAATMERGGSWGNDRRGRETFVGTPCWMAPEVMEQVEGYNCKADIWSFGITLLELANGQAPFAKYPPMKVLLMTLQNPPPQLEEDKTGQRQFSKHMKELVYRCLQKDPNKRPTAAQLLESKFFKNIQDTRYLATHLLRGLPNLVDRVRQLDQGKGKNPAAPKPKDPFPPRGESNWNFDLPALRAQASKELGAVKESDATGQDEAEPSPAPKRPPPPPPGEARPPLLPTPFLEGRTSPGPQSISPLPQKEHSEGGVGGEASASRSETCEGSERGDIPGSPLSDSVSSPTKGQMGSPTRPTTQHLSTELAGTLGGWTESSLKEVTKSEPVPTPNVVNGQKRLATTSTNAKKAVSKSSSRFVMLDKEPETKNDHHTTTTTTPHAASIASSSSLHDEYPPVTGVRAQTETDVERDGEPDKVVQKVGRFEVGIKKEPKSISKHPSIKDMSELGKTQTYVPPATALLPRMVEMMEHLRDQYTALQQMIEVLTEADRGRALSLQKMLGQPLFSKNSPDGGAMEDQKVAELEKKVNTLEADNRVLKERCEEVEKQLERVKAFASADASANGPSH